MLPRAIRAGLLSVAVLLLTAVPALADADLESATPGPDDAITDVPIELVATFTELLVPDRSSIEVRDAQNQVVATGVADEPPTRTMRAPLPPLEPGVYTVRWATYSADDEHLSRDTFSFTVVAAPSPTPTAVPVASPTPTSSLASEPTTAVTPTPAVSSPSPAPGELAAPAVSTDVLLVLLAAGVAVAVIALPILRRR